MADKAQAQAEAEVQEKPRKSRKAIILGGLFLTIMAIEAVVVIVLVKQFSPKPQAAEAGQAVDGLQPGEGQARIEDVEIEIAEVRARNDKALEPVTYSVQIIATVPEDQQEAFNALLTRHQFRIQSRFSSVIRSADQSCFHEPDLTTLSQRFKEELGEICGEDVTLRGVYIPSIVPFTEY